MEKKDTKKVDKREDVDKYPGIQTDIADDEKVSTKDTRQETRILNNNPRNEDM